MDNRLMDDTEYLLERLDLAASRIREIDGEHKCTYAPYFERVAEHINSCISLYRRAGIAGDTKTAPTSLADIARCDEAELARLNASLYRDIIHYDESYLNPDVCTKLFTPKLGGWYAFLYNELMALIPWAYDGRLDLITIYAELFLQMYGIYEEELSTDDVDFNKALHRSNECIYWFYHDYCDVLTKYSVESMLVGSDLIADIISSADLSSTKYLYAYGVRISDNDIKLARYINSLDEDKVSDIASCYVTGFVRGYEMARKDINGKSIVKVEYPIGLERVIKKSCELFSNYDLTPIYARDGVTSFYGGPKSRGTYLSSMNKQWIYDHRNDKGYYFDKRFYNRRLEALEQELIAYKDRAARFAGPAVIETFGEEDFNPAYKDSIYKFDDKQSKWNVEYMSRAGHITNEYMPRDEYSYTIIAFPIPEIGEEAFFREVFDKTMEINTLDSDKYLDMQQCLIDILDRARAVHVLGRGGNKTDITVMLHTLSDPESETNFENCVADVNIPVGEVFTSPVLKGTCGVLSVSRVFLNGLAYHDLTITVEDGMVSDYSCSNFDDESAAKRLIYENVLYRHDTLPIGEFAIGTNTLAYKMAKEYGIEAKLPILIAEKTGPHFAFGDTCYSHEEDVMTYNPNGKKIIARENECSMLRHEDVSKAYFNCHTDVTLPFEELGLIEAVMPDGSKTPIIRDGLFVVDGCEELNKPLIS